MLRIITLTVCCLMAVHASASPLFTSKLVQSGFVIPWGLAFVDNQTMIVMERNGIIKTLDVHTGKTAPLKEVKNVYAFGQGGLFDVATSPFDKQHLYFTYSKTTPNGGATTLASATYTNGTLINWKELLVTDSATKTTRHFGSRITFDAQGHVFFTLGDRGHRPNGQDTSNHAGSILRLNLDGTVPKDNPYIDAPDIKDEIWSYGHRNPQGLFFDKETNTLWSIEHGPRGGDEVNLIKKGANYGWPITSHGKEYWGPVNVADDKEKEGIESPKKVYTPSIAPSNIILYRGKKYPSLNGKLLAGALKLTHINVLTLDNQQKIINEQRIVESLEQRIRDIKVSPSGDIYFCTDSGNIYRLIERADD